MFKLVIKGGRSLKGDAYISGSKNAALPIMCATLLAPGEHRLFNIPKLQDISTLRELLSTLEIPSKENEDGCCSFVNNGGGSYEAAYELVKKMRASILVLGPLLASRGRARVSLPGGCAIGERPVDLHIAALEKMGAKIEVVHGYIEAECDRLKGADIHFNTVTVTGTENILMAASLAEGVTVLHNAAAEPEVADLAECLKTMGAKIEGAGTQVITVTGVERLEPAKHKVMPDRIEAGTMLCAVLACGGDITLHNAPIKEMSATLERLEAAGLNLTTLSENSIRANFDGVPNACDITTKPYPGFPTDMQAQFMAAVAKANGTSIIDETIFENRFMHVAELKRMGADIAVKDGRAVVRGVEKLSGAPVMASDLRASAGLVIAALSAENTSEVLRVYHLDRGYQEFEAKLAGLGADIVRMKA